MNILERQAEDRVILAVLAVWADGTYELLHYEIAPDEGEADWQQLFEHLIRHIRTTNHLERLFREFRTKSDEIGAFPYETSCLTVFFLVVQRDQAKHPRPRMAKTSGH